MTVAIEVAIAAPTVIARSSFIECTCGAGAPACVGATRSAIDATIHGVQAASNAAES